MDHFLVLSILESSGRKSYLHAAILALPSCPANASLETKKSQHQQTNPPALGRHCSQAGDHDTAAPPIPFSTLGAGDSTRCFFASVPPSVWGRLLTSVRADLFTAEGGLYAPRLGGPPPPGIPIRRVGSMEGFVKLDRLGPLPCCGFCCCGPFDALANAVPKDSRMMGADLFGFTPCVLRMEGLSACGLKAAGVFVSLPSAACVRKLALRPVTKPAGTPAGGSAGIGG
jgi:hypothetical protein